ncbi:CapA family protein [Nocardioides marmoriginsengisoli]|uniref:CapA family protein n=1 Tax=Nocardioides marmoriginsengisoli TaxID=661483 RepID=A0A3N0CGB1_9ACTN|nr:CapA family protein [Nocardioides marmoriginsengisoli]
MVALLVLALLATSGCDDAGPASRGSDRPSATASARTPDPSADPAPRTVSVVMGGDLLWHNTVWFSAAEDRARTGKGRRYDFDPMFAKLKPLIASADVALCHEEVPFAAPGQKPESYPVFAAPREVAPWIASMGWDGCTTASNHSWDQGFAGLVTTADLLEANHVRHIGTFRSADERTEPVILTTADGVRVGVVAATYGLNGFVVPERQWWAVSQTTDLRDNLLVQASRARAAGADIVIAHVHWGNEYDHRPNADQVALADALTASPDVDLVLGDHAHVVQPITTVNGKWVAYGLGNMIAQNEVERRNTYEGITVDFEFTERSDGRWVVTRAAYVPTQWNHYTPGNPIRIRNATGARLASVRAAVDGVGGNRGLVRHRLPR